MPARIAYVRASASKSTEALLRPLWRGRLAGSPNVRLPRGVCTSPRLGRPGIRIFVTVITSLLAGASYAPDDRRAFGPSRQAGDDYDQEDDAQDRANVCRPDACSAFDRTCGRRISWQQQSRNCCGTASRRKFTGRSPDPCPAWTPVRSKLTIEEEDGAAPRDNSKRVRS